MHISPLCAISPPCCATQCAINIWHLASDISPYHIRYWYDMLTRYNDKTCQRGISIWHQIQHFLLLVIDIAISISQGTQSTPANSHANAFECLGARRKCGDILPPRSSQRSCDRPWGDLCHNYVDNSRSEEICTFVDKPSMSLTGALPHALLWVLQGGSDPARDCSGAFVRSNIKHL